MNLKTMKICRALRGKRLTIQNIEKELDKLGYSVVYFNNAAGDCEIKRYELEEQKETLKAFTYRCYARLVFVNGKLPPEDRLYLLLHELGHICLKHLGGNNLINNNKLLLDIEADSFAYKIIRKRRICPCK